MTKVNHTFAEHVTSTAFNLTLSKNMIAAMCLVNNKTVEMDVLLMGRNGFIPSIKALKERGLVIHEDPAKMKPKWARYPYSFTEAGEHVYQLLIAAGLVGPLQRTISKHMEQADD